MADQGQAPAGDGSGGGNENFSFLVIAMMWIPAGLLIESLRPFFAIMGFFFLLIYLWSSYKPQGGADGGKKKGDPDNEPESP